MKPLLALFALATCLNAQTNLPPGVKLWAVRGKHLSYYTTRTYTNRADAVKAAWLTGGSPPDTGLTVVSNEFSTNEVVVAFIKRLCDDGEVCKLKGHAWRDGRRGEGNGFVFADYHPNTNYRTCTICGTTQTQSLEWK